MRQITDQAIKLILRRYLAGAALWLNPYSSVRVVAGRLRLRQVVRRCSSLASWRI